MSYGNVTISFGGNMKCELDLCKFAKKNPDFFKKVAAINTSILISDKLRF